MPTSHGYFPPRTLGSSNGFPTSKPVESNGKRPLIEMSSPNSQHLVQSQLGSMRMYNHRVTQHGSYTMPHQAKHRRLGALAPTFPTKTSVDVQRRLPWCSTTQRIPPLIPQMYAIDRRESMGNFTPISGPAGVDDYPKLVNHQAVPKHASSSTAVGYHNQTLKRKAVMAELQLGSSTSVAVESTNDFFRFSRNCQEEHSAKKKKAMAPLLVNEEDTAEALERMAREIDLFPQHVAHELFGNESEFSVYQPSSDVGGFEATLDLSLNLSSSSSGESGMEMDLSLKLHHNP